MNFYQIVEPRFSPTTHRTSSGETVYTVRFFPVPFSKMIAANAEEAVFIAKRGNHINPVVEQVYEN